MNSNLENKITSPQIRYSFYTIKLRTHKLIGTTEFRFSVALSHQFAVNRISIIVHPTEHKVDHDISNMTAQQHDE